MTYPILLGGGFSVSNAGTTQVHIYVHMPRDSQSVNNPGTDYKLYNSTGPLRFPQTSYKGNNHGYILALSYFDQVSAASRRIGCLQCWASHLNMSIVEPFLPGNSTFPGMPQPSEDVASSLRFGDFFDTVHWNRYSHLYGNGLSFSPLVTWEEFIEFAPREVTAVQILHRRMEAYTTPCTFPHVATSWPSFLEPHGFRISRHVCINMHDHGVLSEDHFKSLVFGMQSHNITVIFDEWRGMYHTMSKRVSMAIQSECTNSAVGNTVYKGLLPSSAILQDAQEYKWKYFNGSPYLTVMLRLERMIVYSPDHGLEQLSGLKDSLQCIRDWRGSRPLFVTTDIGMYGSHSLHDSNVSIESAVEFISHVNSVLYGNDSAPSQEDHFERISRVNYPAYVSTLQKVIASEGQCLLLIGGGKYQQQAKKWHTSLKSDDAHLLEWEGPHTCNKLREWCM